MPIFEDILNNTTLDDISDVPPVPVGSYLAMITGPHEMVISNQKKTNGVQFTLRLTQARDDVDQDALREYIEASKQNLRDVQIKHTIWESPYFLQSLRDLLRDTLGINGNLEAKAALAEVPGKDLIVNIIHRPFTDNTGKARLRAEIGSMTKAD